MIRMLRVRRVLKQIGDVPINQNDIGIYVFERLSLANTMLPLHSVAVDRRGAGGVTNTILSPRRSSVRATRPPGTRRAQTCDAGSRRVASGSASFVAMVQSTDFRTRDDVTFSWRLHASWRGRVFLQRQMRA